MCAQYLCLYNDIAVVHDEQGSIINFNPVVASLNKVKTTTFMLHEINAVTKLLQKDNFSLNMGEMSLDMIDSQVQKHKRKIQFPALQH